MPKTSRPDSAIIADVMQSVSKPIFTKSARRALGKAKDGAEQEHLAKVARQNTRNNIRELKRTIAALKQSYKSILRAELGPLKRRLDKLEASLLQKHL